MKTKKLFIEEMSNDQLEKVFHANEKLRDQVIEELEETEMIYAMEQVDCFIESLVSYSYGAPNRNNHIIVDIEKVTDFIDGLRKAREYGMLYAEEGESIVNALDKINEQYREAEMYSDEYYVFEEGLESLLNKVGKMIITDIEDRFYFKDEDVLENFVGFYAHARLEEENTYYVYVNKEDGTSDYILYELREASFK